MALLDLLKKDLGDNPDPGLAIKALRTKFPEFSGMSDQDLAATLAETDASAAFLKAYDPAKAVAPAQPESPVAVKLPTPVDKPVDNPPLTAFKAQVGLDGVPDDILQEVLQEKRPDLFPAPSKVDVLSAAESAAKTAAGLPASTSLRQIRGIGGSGLSALGELVGGFPGGKEGGAALQAVAKKISPEHLTALQTFLAGQADTPETRAKLVDFMAPTEDQIIQKAFDEKRLPTADLIKRFGAMLAAEAAPLTPVQVALTAATFAEPLAKIGSVAEEFLATRSVDVRITRDMVRDFYAIAKDKLDPKVYEFMQKLPTEDLKNVFKTGEDLIAKMKVARFGGEAARVPPETGVMPGAPASDANLPAIVPRGSTTVSGLILGGPEGVADLTAKLPGLSDMIIGKDLPASPDAIQEAVTRAEVINNTALKNGVNPANAEIAGIEAFQNHLLSTQPPLPPAAAPLPGAAPAVTKADLATAMGVKPHELAYDQFKAIYGEGVPDEILKGVHQDLIQKAGGAESGLKAGEPMKGYGSDKKTAIFAHWQEIPDEPPVAMYHVPEGYDTPGTTLAEPEIVRRGIPLPSRIPSYWEDKAIRTYGLTEHLKNAGFILPDGKMIDFARGGAARLYSHHESIEELTGRPNTLYDFMDRTNAIRVVHYYSDAGKEHISFQAKPGLTAEQIGRIRDYLDSTTVAHSNLERISPEGKSIGRSLSIDKPTVDDITRFFNGTTQAAEPTPATPATTPELSNPPKSSPTPYEEKPVKPESGDGFRALQGSRFETKFRKVGAVIIPNQKIGSPADVAFVFRQFRNPVQENFFMIALRKGRIVAIEHLGFGTIDQVAVYPFNTLHILDKTKADSVYISHNHPSGFVTPSEEDKRLTRTLRGVLENHGVRLEGHVIIDDTKFGFIDSGLGVSEHTHQAYAQTQKMAVLQKHFVWKEGVGGPGAFLGSPREVFELQKGIQRDPDEGLLWLLNTQNQIINTVVIPTGKFTAKTFQKIVSAYRPAGLISVNSGLSDREAAALKQAMRPLDVSYHDDVEIKAGEGPYSFRSKNEYGAMETPARYSARENTPPEEGNTDFNPAEYEDNAMLPAAGKPLSVGAEGINVTDPTEPITPGVEKAVRREATALRREELERDPLLDFIKGQGGLRPFEGGVEQEEFNVSVPGYLRGGKIAPGEMAQMAFDAHLIEDPSTNALLDAISRMPRKLPKVGDFITEAAQNVEAKISNWPRVQPGIKSDIESSLDLRAEDKKVYSERQALRRSLQREAATARQAESETVNRLTNVKMQAAEIVQNTLPEIEQGKFLEAIAQLDKVSQLPGFIKKVVARFDAYAKANGAVNVERIRENAARLRELEQVSQQAATRALEDLQHVRDTAAALVNSRLPAAIRGKFITALRDVKSYGDLTSILDRIDNAAKKSERRLLIEGIKNSLRRISATKSIAIDYKDRIFSLMRDYLLATPTEKTLARLNELNDFIVAKKAAGEDVTVPTYVLQQLAKLQAKPLGEMEPAEIRDIATQIEILAELGKTKFRVMKELDLLRKQRDLADITAGAKPLNMRELEQAIRPGEKLTAIEKLANLYRTARNSQLHASVAIKPYDYIFDTLDGFQNFEGPVYRIFKSGRIDPAWNDYKNLADHLRDEITTLAKDLGLDQASLERIGVFAIDQQATGREKLLNNGFTEAEIDGIVLTPAEQQFYRFARARMDEMLPRIRSVMKDLYNAPVEGVRAYWPFITDWELMENDPVDVRLGDQFLALKKNAPQSFVKSRVGAGAQAVEIDALSTYLKHMDDVAYLLTVGQHTKYLGELAGSPEFRAATGDLGSALVREWVDTLARKGGVGGASRIPVLDRLRRALGPAQLGFHIATALVHATPLVAAPGLIGRWAFVGSTKIAQPAWWRFMNANFPEIREMTANDPAFAEFSGTEALRKIQRAGFLPLRAIVKLARVGIGAGAYLKYLHEHKIPMDFAKGNSEAIVYAQRIMNQASASFEFKDMPPTLGRGRLTRNRSLDRLLMQYQNYHLFRWQLWGHMFWDAGVKSGRIGQASNVLFWLLFTKLAEVSIRRGVQAAIDDVTNYKGKERDIAKEATLEALGEIPFIGQIANSLAYDRMPVPVLNAIVSTAEGAKWMVTGKHDTTRERGAIHFIGGMARGLPAIIIPGFPSIPGTAQIEQLLLKTIPKKGH